MPNTNDSYYLPIKRSELYYCAELHMKGKLAWMNSPEAAANSSTIWFNQPYVAAGSVGGCGRGFGGGSDWPPIQCAVTATSGYQTTSNAGGVYSFGSTTPDEACEDRPNIPYSGSHIMSPNQCLAECEYALDDDLNELTTTGESCEGVGPIKPVPEEELGDEDECQGQPFAGNPINFAVGNKLQRENDLSAGVINPLFIERVYNSFSDSNGAFGIRWSSLLDMKLVLAFNGGGYSNRVRIRLPDGSAKIFWSPVVSSDDDWIYEGGRGYKFTEFITGDGYQFVDLAGDSYSFDHAGRLTQVERSGGVVWYLEHGSRGAINVTDNLGREMAVVFSEGSRYQKVESITQMPAGLRYDYYYDANYENLEKIEYYAQSDTENKRSRLYHYEDALDPHLLTGITDERGVRVSSWAYDEQHRANLSIGPDGTDRFQVDYNLDDSVTVTNPLGKQTTYRFTRVAGKTKVFHVDGHQSPNCAASSRTYTYDENGFFDLVTDWNGNVTDFDHNDRGLEVSRTEALGTPSQRTITTDWHERFDLPIRVTEPGRITEWSYSEVGSLIEKTVYKNLSN